MGHEPPEPLGKLLKSWAPRPAEDGQRFVGETLRRLRCEEPGSAQEEFWDGLAVFLEKWLPSPAAFLPVAACLVLLVAGGQWSEAREVRRTRLALEWSREVSKPLTDASVAGAYARISEKGWMK